VPVTDRDRVVAELGPPAPGRSPLDSDALLLDVRSPGVDQATAIGWKGNAGPKAGDEAP
jgi:hypothetical protein